MNRSQRFEAIAVCTEEALTALAESVLALGVAPAILQAPIAGSVMMRARDASQGGVFNLGEVVATQAEVAIEGERGYALVMGVSARRALAGAIVDAAAEALPEIRPAVETVLTGAIEAEQARRRARIQRVAGTRVEFDEIP